MTQHVAKKEERKEKGSISPMFRGSASRWVKKIFALRTSELDYFLVTQFSGIICSLVSHVSHSESLARSHNMLMMVMIVMVVTVVVVHMRC